MMLKAPVANISVKEVRNFFYSQAFADGFRTTFGILTPALLGSYIGHFEEGMTVSLGAMCVSLTDAPGPISHKRNGMVAATVLAFLMAVVTAFARVNPLVMGIEVALVTFFFSMFVVYGARATAVGNTAILIMILTMDRPIGVADILPHAALILGGGLFYLATSLLLYQLAPYRNAQRALGECIREIADYLAIKADFYNPATDLDENYRRMVSQHIVVHEKQDGVREIFFKTRQIVEESTQESRKLIFTFVEAVDLFENITAAYYDYHSLRELFGDTGALTLVHGALKRIEGEVAAVGAAIQSNTSFRKSFDYDGEIKRIKAAIDAVPVEGHQSKLVLRRIVVNIRAVLTNLNRIAQYFETGIRRKRTGVDHARFVSSQSFDPRLFTGNLNLQSSTFRHALRVCLACVLGYLIAKLLNYGQHSYWILLTIAFIIKPAFSLTKQRNIERIIGTVIGGAVGAVLVLTISSHTALFVIMVLFMIATYSFMRINYLAMVLCVTPYVIILFSILGTAFRQAATERIIDTAIACVIAFLVSYFLFPSWEAGQLKSHMQGIVRANALYLQKIIKALSGEAVTTLEYKLARKEVYLASANLSAAFQRMVSEPKSKQSSRSQVQQFVVLNHILFSNIATIATWLLGTERRQHSADLLHVAKKSYHKLEESKRKLGDEGALPKPGEGSESTTPFTHDDELMKEQLNFIYSVSKDIGKISATVG